MHKVAKKSRSYIRRDGVQVQVEKAKFALMCSWVFTLSLNFEFGHFTLLFSETFLLPPSLLSLLKRPPWFLLSFCNVICVKGNTWTCEILWQIYNDGASSDVNISNRVYWFDVHPLLRRSEPKQSESSPNPKPVIELLPSPRLLKSHLPYHVIPKGQDEATACKYIYVARNPKDAATSLYHFYQTIPGVMEDDISLETMVQIFLQGTGEYLPTYTGWSLACNWS